MKLLVLGANGQLGSDLLRVHGASPKKCEIVPLTRKEIDISNSSSIAKLHHMTFDVLINCASYNRVDDAEDHAEEAFRINASAVGELATVCQKKNARLLHVSTDYVFDGRHKEPYVESDATGPMNVYGASKLKGETVAFSACRDVTVLRVASLFGVAGSSGKGGNFVETMIRVGKEKGKLTVVNDSFMSPTSTFDVAKIIFALLERGAEPGIYHTVNSGEASWYDFACEILRRARVHADVIPVPSSEYPTRARRPLWSVLRNEKIVQIVGPIPHWTEALDHYLREKGHIT